ncbi:hypothetical protein [Microbacterium sp. bgisy189]|uniref:hypothetical protein n=1 Tax=Microbacterium sp. bgisy189 TaxID=3413798 RepID=UPI003EBDFBB6
MAARWIELLTGPLEQQKQKQPALEEVFLARVERGCRGLPALRSPRRSSTGRALARLDERSGLRARALLGALLLRRRLRHFFGVARTR